MVSAVAELEEEMIRERTRVGLAAARGRGARIGRPQVRLGRPGARNLLSGGQSLRQVARMLGIGAFKTGTWTVPVDQPQVAEIIQGKKPHRKRSILGDSRSHDAHDT